MCLEIYEPEPILFLTASGLAWQIAIKKAKVKLDLLTDIDFLLTVKKGIRGKTCHTIHQYTEANNKYLRTYYKNKEALYLNY